jgi:hypothetical protein
MSSMAGSQPRKPGHEGARRALSFEKYLNRD